MFHPDQGQWLSCATTGSVSFNFERKGQTVVPAEGVDFDNLFEKAAEAGAEDVTDDGEVFTVITDPSDNHRRVRKALHARRFRLRFLLRTGHDAEERGRAEP